MKEHYNSTGLIGRWYIMAHINKMLWWENAVTWRLGSPERFFSNQKCLQGWGPELVIKYESLGFGYICEYNWSAYSQGNSANYFPALVDICHILPIHGCYYAEILPIIIYSDHLLIVADKFIYLLFQPLFNQLYKFFNNLWSTSIDQKTCFMSIVSKKLF